MATRIISPGTPAGSSQPSVSRTRSADALNTLDIGGDRVSIRPTSQHLEIESPGRSRANSDASGPARLDVNARNTQNQGRARAATDKAKSRGALVGMTVGWAAASGGALATGFLAGAVIGGALGSVIPVAGTLGGAIVGGIIGVGTAVALGGLMALGAWVGG
ncbi:MAG: hypothetical protein AAFY56_21390, partial [Pseudomonadota bacterium]